ncbi:MAG: aspartate aminotransferase family protein [Clostridiales bacterium]|nr:aspartate aminotransferase family protein [Clostridiales bacterium]
MFMKENLKLAEVMEYDKKYYMNTFGSRIPVCFTHGKGLSLWDTEGREYSDMLGGIAVNLLGHGHPGLVGAISAQAAKMIHCSSLYYIEPQALLAKALAENSCADRVFFANSGAEANEGAIKLARIYFKKKNQPQKYEVITLQNSFHGRTMATLTATGQEKFHKPFTPLLPGFNYVPLNDFEALAASITENTCAIMLEPIQGESGVNLVSADYVQRVVKLCKEKDLLLIFDEIQTGMGRTGKLFAYEHYNIEPDIFTLAKGLAGGVPIGALCAREEVAAAFAPGDHGSTFGGNPLATAAGLAVMEAIEKEGLLKNAELMGIYMKEQLKALIAKHSLLVEIRGLGLMVGIQLAADKAVALKTALFEQGVLVGSVGASVIRVLPPLIITRADIDSFVCKLDSALATLEK